MAAAVLFGIGDVILKPQFDCRIYFFHSTHPKGEMAFFLRIQKFVRVHELTHWPLVTKMGTCPYIDWRQTGQVLESHVLEESMWAAASTQVFGPGKGVGE